MMPSSARWVAAAAGSARDSGGVPTRTIRAQASSRRKDGARTARSDSRSSTARAALTSITTAPSRDPEPDPGPDTALRRISLCRHDISGNDIHRRRRQDPLNLGQQGRAGDALDDGRTDEQGLPHGIPAQSGRPRQAEHGGKSLARATSDQVAVAVTHLRSPPESPRRPVRRLRRWRSAPCRIPSGRAASPARRRCARPWRRTGGRLPARSR